MSENTTAARPVCNLCKREVKGCYTWSVYVHNGLCLIICPGCIEEYNKQLIEEEE